MQDAQVDVLQLGKGMVVSMAGSCGIPSRAAFTQDCARVVVAERSGLLWAWDARTGDFIGKLELGFEPRALAGREDLVLAAGERGRVALFRLPGEKSLWSVAAHDETIVSLAISPEGRRVCAGAFGGWVTLLEIPTGVLCWNVRLFSPDRYQGVVWAVGFSGDGRSVAAGGSDGSVRIVDADARGVREWIGHARDVQFLCFDPSGKRLATAGLDGMARLWDLEKGSEAFADLPEGPIVAAAFSPAGDKVALARPPLTDRAVKQGRPGEVELIDLQATPSRRRSVRFAQGFPIDVAFTGRAEGETLWAGVFEEPRGGREGFLPALQSWDVENLHPEVHAPGGGAGMLALSPDPDGTRLAGVNDEGFVTVWKVNPLRVEVEFDAEGSCVAWSPDGSSLAVGTRGGEVHLWDTRTWRRRRTIEGGGGMIRHIAFSPRDSILATLSINGKVRVWSAGTGVLLREFETGVSFGELALRVAVPVRALAWSPCGSLLAFGGSRHAVVLVEVASGGEVGRLVGHRGGVLCVAFSPDGRKLCSGAADMSAIVWDLTRPLEGIEAAGTWDELRGANARRARAALVRLAARPGAGTLLREKLLEAPDPRRIEEEMAALDSDDIERRERAREALVEIGPAAEGALRARGERHPEIAKVLSAFEGPIFEAPAVLQRVRALEALEMMGERGILEEVAAKSPWSDERRRAASAALRVKTRSP